jgi:subtilisin family serine protease
LRSSLLGRAGLLRCLLLSLVSVAPAGAAPRLSPALTLVAEGRLSPTLLPATADGWLRVFLRYGGGAAELRAAGIEPGVHAGSWWTAQVRPETLARLDLPGAYLQEAHLLRTQLDRSVPATGATAARVRDPELDGHGAIVGIVDTGVDLSHPDFRRPDGTTRVLYLMDLAAGAGGLHPELATAPNSSVFTAVEIDRALALRTVGLPSSPPLIERDPFGHGTHVTGIAVGNGRATGAGLPAGRYVGMAPGADLIVVKGTRGISTSFADTDVADGVSFIFTRAAELGRPAVVNLSLGGQAAAHTGHSAMEELISAMIGTGKAGRAVVVAAGNDGGADLHASGSLGDDEQTDVPMDIAPYDPTKVAGTPQVSCEIWYPGDQGMEVAVTTPNGRELAAVTLGTSSSFDTPEGTVTIANAPAGPDAASGRNGVFVQWMAPSGGVIHSGRWQLRLAGRVRRWDLWLTTTTLPGEVVLRGALDPDDHLTIPGLAEDVITVASYTTKQSWRSFLGRLVERGLQEGRASEFSGTGPSADGRFKPDLAAPGEFIAAALSSDALPDEPQSAFFTPLRSLWADDGVHGLLRGTSMATPHVTGAVALLLSRRPDLDAPRLRELLRATARTGDDSFNLGATWSPKWGFGRLAVDLAIRAELGERGQVVDPAVSTVGSSRDFLAPGSGNVAVLTVVPKDAEGLPLGPGHTVEIDAAGGSFVDDVQQVSEWGRWERRLAAGRQGGKALVTVRVDDVTLTRQPVVWFVRSRDQIGASEAAGCASTGRGLPSGVAAGGLFGGLLLLWSWRRGRGRGRQRRA